LLWSERLILGDVHLEIGRAQCASFAASTEPLAQEQHEVCAVRRAFDEDPYQDTYLNLGTNEWEKPTADLKAVFRKITSLVKTRCPTFEYKPGSNVFIAPKARAMLEANAATISAD
jgi:hypothetical protein